MLSSHVVFPKINDQYRNASVGFSLVAVENTEDKITVLFDKCGHSSSIAKTNVGDPYNNICKSHSHKLEANALSTHILGHFFVLTPVITHLWPISIL